LQSPAEGEPLLLYITASHKAVSAVLVKEQSDNNRKVQAPVYYVSELLMGSKLLYSEVEKLAYAVVMAMRKLKHYFMAHEVTIPTSYPIRDVCRNRESIGRISKWSAEIAPFIINFVLRASIKSQCVADFIAEWSVAEEDKPEETIWQIWHVEVDGD
jgi:hypothetical protein